jgi:hypothetical protein
MRDPAMTTKWRLGTVNGLLLALYFVPVWTFSAMRIVTFPLRGVYERAHIGPALFLNDYFQLLASGTVRLAWLLALGKLVVVTFFCVFAIFTVRGALTGRGDGREALGLAVVIGAVICFASMVMASLVGESGAVQLNATESLMLLGGLAILAVDPDAGARASATPAPGPMQQPAAT